jgi:hypothetical protein
MGLMERLQIVLILNSILSFCYAPEILLLYKKLCNYYFIIDHNAAIIYARFYFKILEPEKYKHIVE